MKTTTTGRFQPFIAIYYCATFVVYSASFLTFFWELQSLLLRFTLSDIIGFLSYQLAFALIESVLVSVVIFLLICVLPMRQIKENRSVAGVFFVFSFAISSLIFKAGTKLVQWLSATLPITGYYAIQFTLFLWLFAAFGLPILSILMIRAHNTFARIKALIDNLSVIASMYTALGVIGILMVIYRNLL